MFRECFFLETSILERILNKIQEDNLPIESEIGVCKNGQAKVLFEYEDRKLLDRIIKESTNEEYDLI